MCTLRAHPQFTYLPKGGGREGNGVRPTKGDLFPNIAFQFEQCFVCDVGATQVTTQKRRLKEFV